MGTTQIAYMGCNLVQSPELGKKFYKTGNFDLSRFPGKIITCRLTYVLHAHIFICM